MIRVKGIIWEDFVNYKKPCMIIEMPICDFKCDRDCGQKVCQNSSLAISETRQVDEKYLVSQYIDNPITEAVCFQGLEPFDSFDDMMLILCELFNSGCTDDIVIYTGYNKDEIDEDKIQALYIASSGNLIIKWGRYIPNQESRFDDILGVTLASSNQYAEKVQYNKDE